VKVPQDHHLAPRSIEPGNQPSQPIHRLLPFHPYVGGRLGARPQIVIRVPGQTQPSADLQPTRPITHQIHSDPVQPRPKRIRRLDLRQPPNQPQEDLLAQVVDLVPIVPQRQEQAPDGHLMAIDDLDQRLGLSALISTDENTIVSGCCFTR